MRNAVIFGGLHSFWRLRAPFSLGKLVNILPRWLLGGCVVLSLALTGCGGTAEVVESPAPVKPSVPIGQEFSFPAPQAWGGDVRCANNRCRLVFVEHEEGALVLAELNAREAKLMDRQPLAYHPDSAAWINDQWVVAAVEAGGTLDFFEVRSDKLVRQAQIPIGFSPRDVTLARSQADTHTFIATPYGGSDVAVVKWSEGQRAAEVQKVKWCKTPWHPVKVSRTPNGGPAGFVTACLDDKRVIFVPEGDLTAAPVTLASFKAPPRNVGVTPSGKWLYVALEVTGTSVRIDMDTGVLQPVEAAPSGSLSVAAIDDTTVVWGGLRTLEFRKYDVSGQVLNAHTLRSSGFPGWMRWMDLNRDGEPELLILHASGPTGKVMVGPVWR